MMVDGNKTEYGYHLFAHYREYNDVRFTTKFFDVDDVHSLREEIKGLLNEGYDEGEIYVIYGQGRSFTSTKEIITDIKLVSK